MEPWMFIATHFISCCFGVWLYRFTFDRSQKMRCTLGNHKWHNLPSFRSYPPSRVCMACGYLDDVGGRIQTAQERSSIKGLGDEE